MSEGDLGAPRRTGGRYSVPFCVGRRDFNCRYCYSDAFLKREKASEDYSIRMREKERLAELKKKLETQCPQNKGTR